MHFFYFLILFMPNLIASSFFYLSGYEEFLSKKKDRFGRFLYSFSNYKEDKIYLEPMVDIYRDQLIQQLNVSSGCSNLDLPMFEDHLY